MASLHAHLVRLDEHDRLRFHPQCPRCRAERLEGALSDGPLVPLRAQAVVAVGVLACTSLAPTTAFATGVDDEIEGTAAPGQLTPDVEAQGELDAVGESEPEPTDARPTDALPADATPDEPTPEPQSATSPVPERDDGGTATQVPAQPEAEVADSAGVPSTEVQAMAKPAAPATDAAFAKHAKEARAKSRARVKRELVRVKGTVRSRAPRQEVRVTPVVAAPASAVTPVAAAPASAVADAPASTTATASAPQPRTVAVAASVSRGEAAKTSDEYHVVQPGESLWSIAADLVGDDASPARVAREVSRLWELNKQRIGTGDRNLLMAGTRLEL